MKNLRLYIFGYHAVLSLAKELIGTLVIPIGSEKKYYYVDYDALLQSKEWAKSSEFGTLSCIYTFIRGITNQNSVYVLDQNQRTISELVWDYKKKTYEECEL